MTRLRRGSLAVLLAVVILVCSVCPVRVRAVSVGAGLVAVAGAVAITAYLNASGIYPFDGSLDNYRSGLASLLDSYNSGVAANRTVTEEVIKAYLVNGAIAIAKDSWERLCAFAGWVVDEYSLTDNQSAVQITASAPGYLSVFTPPATEAAMRAATVVGASTQTGGKWDVYGKSIYGASTLARTKIFYMPESSGLSKPYVFVADVTDLSDFTGQRWCLAYYNVNYGSTADSLMFDTDSFSVSPYTYNGKTFITSGSTRFASVDFSGGDVTCPYGNVGSAAYPLFNAETIYRYFYGDLASAGGAGVIVDTGGISIPDALPEDAQFGGLAVPGVSSVAGVSAVTQAVEQGVTDRTKPGVRVVDVTVAEGVEVDTVTGEVTDVTPVEISPSAVLPAVSDFSLPADISQGFQTKFPFSLGFTALRFITPLNKDPVAPKIRWTFSVPILSGDTQYTLEVDLAPWNDIALICRMFQTVIIWVGFALSCRKFLFL